MSNTNNGGPAFPCKQYAHGISPSGHSEGMTLRDYFAAAALTGMLSNSNKTPKMVSGTEYRSLRHYAAAAYEQADAMLAARGTP